MGLSRRLKNTSDLVAMMVDEVGYPALFIDRREAHTGSLVVNFYNAYFTVTTGQWAFKIRYWAVEPKNNLLTLDRFRIPITISSIPFSLA